MAKQEMFSCDDQEISSSGRLESEKDAWGSKVELEFWSKSRIEFGVKLVGWETRGLGLSECRRLIGVEKSGLRLVVKR